MLIWLGTERFGPPDAQTRLVIDGMTDLDRLEQLTRELFRAGSWQELLANP
jgi:hypothetical protein